MLKGWAALTAVAALAAAAFAEKDELIAQARTLVAEAQPFIEQANDADLSLDGRKAPRKEAFRRLKEARARFDEYLDANPAQEEKLDAEYVQLNVLLYGLKKDSAVGELEKEKDAPPDLPPAKGDVPVPVPPAPSTGGDAAKPPAPAAADPESMRRQLAALREYDARHPGDLGLLQMMYERFLRDFPETSTPEYEQAAKRLGEINQRIRTVFQQATQRDVDSLARAEGDEKKTIPARLVQDFNSNDLDVRRRAAKILASTRSGAATYFLAKGVRDRDAEVEATCKQGLIEIGGTRAGANLCGFYLKSSHENRLEALDVLYAIFRKSDGDAATIGPWIGRFAYLQDGPVALAALKFLKQAGRCGGPGLLYALGTSELEKKFWICDALADVGYVKCVSRLGGWLGDAKENATLRNEAMSIIPRFGVAAVPYLIPHLEGATARFASQLLHQISGAPEDVKTQKDWRIWWEGHKPSEGKK